MRSPTSIGMQKGGKADGGLTDPLTGLGTARRFVDKIERLVLERADDPAPFAVGIIDLDGFRPINDLFGRKAGDDILQQAASRLRAALDDSCSVARVGPDEFAMLCPLTFSEQAMERSARMMIEVLSAPYDVGGRTARLSASVGCALLEAPGETADCLLAKAETALYHAKRAGPGQVIVYTLEMEEAARRVAHVEQALRRAVAAGEVEPFYQPIVDLASRHIAGFEVLARWHDEELGSVPPSTFIPIAEERGIVAEMMQSLLRQTTRAAANWPRHISLAVNLSPSQLLDQATARQIFSILDETGFDPRRLEVEITETGLMGDPASATKLIDELRRAGIRIALDDFGTGQSSLGRLREFRFDKLKIDRAFVATIIDDRVADHIVQAILAMGDGLGLDVVAEGIEHEAQAGRLLAHGCPKGQGYLFGRPADAARTTALIAREGAPALYPALP